MTQRTDLAGDLAFLDGRRTEMTAILRDWCAINSGSSNLDGLAEMRAALCAAFDDVGAEVETLASAPHAVVTNEGEVVEKPVGDCLRLVKRPQAPVRVLLAGHMDTVFGPEHPFQDQKLLDEDTLNAPGGADMKGGLLVMLYALKAIEASRFAERIGYEVIINADEEIGSHGSLQHLCEAAGRAHFACVYEPALADGTLAGARKGSGNFSAVFRGRSAHAGREHHLGRNALVAAADFAAEISKLTGAREGLTINVARIDGGGPNNVVPDRAVVRFNARVEASDDADFVSGRIAALLAAADAREGYSARLHGGFGRPPKPMTPDLQAFFDALKDVGAELGLDVAWKATGGCCDGNNIAEAGIPVIDTLGARGAHIHSSREYVRLDSLEERARLSALLLLRIAAGDIPAPGASVGA